MILTNEDFELLTTIAVNSACSKEEICNALNILANAFHEDKDKIAPGTEVLSVSPNQKSDLEIFNQNVESEQNPFFKEKSLDDLINELIKYPN